MRKGAGHGLARRAISKASATQSEQAGPLRKNKNPGASPGSLSESMVSVTVQLALRTAARPIAARPRPSNVSVPGSGVAPVGVVVTPEVLMPNVRPACV